jgi:hypothetical protein
MADDWTSLFDPSRMFMNGSSDPWNTVFSANGSGLTQAADGSGVTGLSDAGMQGLGKGIAGATSAFGKMGTAPGQSPTGGFAPPPAPPDQTAAGLAQLANLTSKRHQEDAARSQAGADFSAFLKKRYGLRANNSGSSDNEVT